MTVTYVSSNIFIEFDIIRKSSAEKLRKELDLLLQLKNNIYVWSKSFSTRQMRDYCIGIKFINEEKNDHIETLKLREEGNSYEAIHKELKVPIWKIGFYLSTDPNKSWTLDDWIKDYMVKDSSIYQKVDFIVDPDCNLVNRFKNRGIDGNCLNEIR